MKTRLRLGIVIWLSVLIMGVVAGQEKADQPKNVELTNAAWDVYKGGNFAKAITAADRCIDRFKIQADGDQLQLKKTHVPLPPTGKVTDEQKKVIYAQGVLNDVATCFWIKGMSAQKLHRNDEAKEAFKAASTYTYARTWDPKGWFWSPAEDATDRLQDLK